MFDDAASIEPFLLNKAIDPLSEDATRELLRIEGLKIDDFKEADVRAEIIDPIVRILGYRKGEETTVGIPTVDREKEIKFLGTNKFIDYSLMFWKRDFWLIEAKRPDLTKENFGPKELSQAIVYAVHPAINAALVVLCDGYKIQLFDIEKDVEQPITSILVSQISLRIDELRRLLGPTQVWFFYKRRVLRAIDRAFDHEMNQKRVLEFRDMIDKRITEKRSQIQKNLQSLKLFENDHYTEMLKESTVDDIVDCHFFIGQNLLDTEIMIGKLVQNCSVPSTFNVLHKMFPEQPRDANDFFYSHGLIFLMELEKAGVRPNWLPTWLTKTGDSNTIKNVTRSLLSHCLNYFDEDQSRKTVLLASNTFRRIVKTLSLNCPDLLIPGRIKHAMTRYWVPEFSWEQILSSPERHSILEWDRQVMTMTDAFVRKHLGSDGKYRTNVAKEMLKWLWNFEKEILHAIDNYKDLLKEKNLEEIHPTEACCVEFDLLGHCCLGIVAQFPEWKDYALSEHRREIKLLSDMQSFTARELLGLDPLAQMEPCSDQCLADRFFFGDLETMRELRAGYCL